LLTCILYVYWLIASPPSFFSVLYLADHSICPHFLFPRSSPCVAPVVQQSPRGPFYFVPPCAFFPCPCPCICPTHPPTFHARARAITAARGFVAKRLVANAPVLTRLRPGGVVGRWLPKDQVFGRTRYSPEPVASRLLHFSFSAWLRSVEKYGRGHFSTANSGGDLVRRRLLSHLFLKRFHHGPFFFERLPGETSRRRRQIQKSGATAAADRVRHFTMGLWYCTKDTAPLVCPGAVWVRLIGITLQQARRGISRRSSTSTAKGPSCWTGGGRLRRNVS